MFRYTKMRIITTDLLCSCKQRGGNLITAVINDKKVSTNEIFKNWTLPDRFQLAESSGGSTVSGTMYLVGNPSFKDYLNILVFGLKH